MEAIFGTGRKSICRAMGRACPQRARTPLESERLARVQPHLYRGVVSRLSA